MPETKWLLNAESSQQKKTTRKHYRKTLQENTTGKHYRKAPQESDVAENSLDLCRTNPAITIPEMAVKLELTEDGINYHLGKLRAQNRLARVGGRKFGHWVAAGSGDE